MSSQQAPGAGGSRAVQGCLIGAVLLFALLLVVLIVLAYGRFRENTGVMGPSQTPVLALGSDPPPLPASHGTL